MRSGLGRGLLAAAAIKALLLVAGATGLAGTQPAWEYLDRAVNLGLLFIAGAWAFRLTGSARSRLLWGVRRRLVLSYILIGAVPILLLVAFGLLAFLLVVFDVSSYLVRTRFTELSARASSIARTTLLEIERAPEDERPALASQRHAALRAEHPGITLTVIPTAGEPACGASFPSDAAASASTSARSLPRWVSCRGFSGLILRDGSSGATKQPSLAARAAALPDDPSPRYALVVDLPVDDSLAATSLEGTGIRLGNQRSLFNTATFVAYVDWPTGQMRQATVPMGVEVATLYRWLGGTHAGVTFNRLLVYVLFAVGALLLVIEVVALGNGLALARSITAAVDGLFGGTERVKGGDFEHAIAVRSGDQLGELATSFNDMTRTIGTLLIEQNEKRRLEEELRIARDIQMSLLPREPLTVPGLSIAGLCVPAREVGGDYYDFLPLPDGRLGLLIADVSGKGTSAALYMAELKGLMLSLSRIHTSPRELLVEANRILSRHLDRGSFITMIYAIIDVQAKLLTCARAGHAPFILVPADRHHPRRARLLAPDGMVLGLNLDDGSRFERTLQELTLPLHEGDLLFFFTDGITDAMNPEGGSFGEPRLVALLESQADLPADAIRGHLVGEIDRFVGGQPQHDDITMIIVKVTG